MYVLYVVLTTLLLPLVVVAEGWKSLRNPALHGRIAQRLGFVPAMPEPGCLWMHAVSVGEVQAAAGLLQALRARHPALPVLLSTVTPTGAQRARALFGDTVRHCYLPFDTPGAIQRFLDRVQPGVAIILETELWPALYRGLKRRRVPLVIASARLTERSVRRYLRAGSLIRHALESGVIVGAQSVADAGRFHALGAPNGSVHVTGNVKLDLQIPQAAIDAGRAFRRHHAASRPVWIAGSTHEGEEVAALEAHLQVRRRHPDALLVLVPRHPQRFEAVHAALARAGVGYAQRSAGAAPGPAENVFLLDTLGELQSFYAAADLAFVGGTLVPVGGHNLLEPAVLGLPVLAGPYTHNAPEIAELLAVNGGLTVVRDAAELGLRVADSFDDPVRAAAAGARGRSAVEQSRGAVERVVALIEPLLRSPAVAPPTAAG